MLVPVKMHAQDWRRVLAALGQVDESALDNPQAVYDTYSRLEKLLLKAGVLKPLKEVEHDMSSM